MGPIIGRSLYIGEYAIDCRYPLAADLGRICYPDASSLGTPEAEERLADSIESGDSAPVDRLARALLKADYYLAGALARDQSEHRYGSFLDRFPCSDFLTYNYDALVELLLFNRRRWSPLDGYGVPVAADISRHVDYQGPMRSDRLVLHLHGSLCVHAREFSFGAPNEAGLRLLEVKDEPDFLFDPDSIADHFFPFTRVFPGLSGFAPMGQRIIAPVPEKAEGLRRAFHRRVREKATEVLRSSEFLIAVGYSFSEHDRPTYARLLDAYAERQGRTVLVVTPTADEVTSRLRASFPTLEWRPVPETFAAWVDGGFAGAPVVVE